MHASRLVLIVDDEPLIRRVLRHTLEGAGYDVVEASNGLEALAMFAHNHHGISAVFSDVSMPEMDGFELARKLRSLAPSVSVVLASGGYSHLGDQSLKQHSPLFLLEKPYSRTEVLTAISGAISTL